MAQTPPFRTLADIPRVHGAHHPDRCALLHEGRATSWSRWDGLCSRVARALVAAGLQPASRVGYLGKNSDRFFHVFFGVARAAMVTVPVNWRLAPSEISFVLDDAQCEVLFVGADFLPLLPGLRAGCPRLREVIAVDGPADGAVALDDWLAPHPALDPGVTAGPQDVALQLYTSGTTGLPKGAQLTHANLLFAASLGGTELLGRWRGDDLSVLPLPLFHAGGLVYGLNGPHAGCTTLVVREASADHIIAALQQAPRPATRLGVVPAVMQMLLNQPALDTVDLGALRTLTYGGAPIPPAVLRQAIARFGPVLVQLFGMTETCTIGTALLPSDHDPSRPERLLSCGRPLPGVELRIVHGDGRAAAAGESGEILVRSPAVMKGYWHREEATRDALRDGWYHSGDVGTLDADGYLRIQDRLKDMIVSGGENVYPAEVERVLADHPAVADVAVFGVPDPTWGEAVRAAVVLRPGQAVSAAALIDFARERIAGYKCPKAIDWMEALPRNASGKLLKRVLREPYWAGLVRNVN